jgi:hypothetical protein
VVDSDEESQPDDDEISNAEVEVADLIESSEDEAATPLPSAGRRGGAAAKRGNTQGACKGSRAVTPSANNLMKHADGQ